jgi:hypothetical protein
MSSSKEERAPLTAGDFAKYLQAKALDEVIEATKNLSAEERHTVFQMAANPITMLSSKEECNNNNLLEIVHKTSIRRGSEQAHNFNNVLEGGADSEQCIDDDNDTNKCTSTKVNKDSEQQTSSPKIAATTNETASPLEKLLTDYPEMYPNGDKTIYINKSEQELQKKPVIGWAKQCSNKVYRCLGVFVCPNFHECNFRERPQVPRRDGRGKQPSKGVPPPKRNCWKHKDAELILIKCKCRWTIKDHSDASWELQHNGTHDHPTPPPVQASHKAKKELRQIIEHNPSLKPSQLTTGIGGGKTNSIRPVGELDPKFNNTGYTAHIRKNALKAISKQATGSEYGYDHLDAIFDYVEQVEDRSPGFLLDSSMGPTRQFLSYASHQMQELAASPVTGFSTDSIEGFVESRFFKGEINVTMTSTWCPVLCTQAPVLISVLCQKSSNSYSIHWDLFFPFAGKNSTSLDEFYESFPGNTSDFSEAIKSSFMSSVDKFCHEKFQRLLSDQQKRDLYRYCGVHYLRNVNRIAKISAVVHPSKRDAFIYQASQLQYISNFDDFVEAVLDLYEEFPLLQGWFLWYLQDDRASIFFPAVRGLSEADMKKYDSMKKDTNAQEGLGGFLQSLKSYNKMPLMWILEAIELFIKSYDHRRDLEKGGMSKRYEPATPKEKKRGREARNDYKAPESTDDFFRNPQSHKKTKTAVVGQMRNESISSLKFSGQKLLVRHDHHAPVQLNNDCQMCFANSLFQNLYASESCRSATINTPIELEDMLEKEKHPFVLLRKQMTEIANMEQGTLNVTPTHLKTILSLLSSEEYLNYKKSEQLDPIELLD